MSVSISQILIRKRSGGRHSPEEIQAWVDAVKQGTATRAQIGAWLMAVYQNSLDHEETVLLTEAMANSGERFSWAGLQGPFVDKHSPGGVGDKTSHVLAPLWASLGFRVPMVSGRSLLHTGGTVDKLESLGGFRCDLDSARLREVLADVGCFISSQTSDIAPADGVLYALREETQTVDCIPLITASILAKKLTEGLDELHLVVWVGSGSNIERMDMGRELAQWIPRVGARLGLRTRVVLADQSQPLGAKVGNLLEMQEVVDCLKGGGPADLRQVVLAVADHPKAAEHLDNGAAYKVFRAMVRAQGGDPDLPESDEALARTERLPILASASGTILECDARSVGLASFVLGAGREQAGQPVIHDVGVILHRKRGDVVRAGDLLAELVHVGRGVGAAREWMRRAYDIGAGPAPERPLIFDTIAP